MRFVPFASSSRGNCYLVDDGQTKVLLECGLSLKEIQRHLQHRLSDVAGMLLTHEHQDHAKAVTDLARRGIDCYMTEGTAKALGASGHRIKLVEPRRQFSLGTLEVLPFETQHDAAAPVGYLIYSRTTNDKLLYATDTFYIRYKFKGLTIIAVECNYSRDILLENVAKDLVPEAVRDRLGTSHFSLENVKEFLRANDLSNVQEIWLIHLSDSNSDAERFKREIQVLTGRPVYIAGE